MNNNRARSGIINERKENRKAKRKIKSRTKIEIPKFARCQEGRGKVTRKQIKREMKKKKETKMRKKK